MLWFLAIHIMALLFWCAALLYLPALIAASHRDNMILHPPKERSSMPRFIFTNVSSPAALVAIIAGTAVFLLNGTVDFWLIAKLTLVTGLVITHALTGMLLLRIDQHPEKPVFLWCWLLEIAFFALMAGIIWVVLAKPAPGVFP